MKYILTIDNYFNKSLIIYSDMEVSILAVVVNPQYEGTNG